MCGKRKEHVDPKITIPYEGDTKGGDLLRITPTQREISNV